MQLGRIGCDQKVPKIEEKNKETALGNLELEVRNDLFSEQWTQLTYRPLVTQVKKIRFTVALRAQWTQIEDSMRKVLWK